MIQSHSISIFPYRVNPTFFTLLLWMINGPIYLMCSGCETSSPPSILEVSVPTLSTDPVGPYTVKAYVVGSVEQVRLHWYQCNIATIDLVLFQDSVEISW